MREGNCLANPDSPVVLYYTVVCAIWHLSEPHCLYIEESGKVSIFTSDMEGNKGGGRRGAEGGLVYHRTYGDTVNILFVLF